MDEHNFTCKLCNLKLGCRSNYYRHVRDKCPVKILHEETKQYYEKLLENIREKLEMTNEELKTTREELIMTKNDLLKILSDDRTYLQNAQQTAASTIDKSVDALKFLSVYRKTAPELKQLTQEKAQALLTHETKLYDYLLYYNTEDKLDEYIGDIILKYIKKEDPDEQSVWNSDVSRLTYLIREIVDESPTWLRDPNGAMFDKKIISPFIDEIHEYLNKCLYSKNPKEVKLVDKFKMKMDHSTDESDEYAEREMMRRRRDILSSMRTLKNTKFKKKLSEYIASRILLHKMKNNSKDKKSNIEDDDSKIIKKASRGRPRKHIKIMNASDGNNDNNSSNMLSMTLKKCSQSKND